LGEDAGDFQCQLLLGSLLGEQTPRD